MKRRVIIRLSVLAITLATLLLLAGLSGAMSPTGSSSQLAGPAPTPTAVMHVLSYQGQVKMGGSPYNGSGYFKFAVVDEPGTSSYWSNDGTSTGGGEPTDAVSLTVSGGLFNVLLGDTSVPGMTRPLYRWVFSEYERYLRVWFSDDDLTYQQLTPDRRIAAVPYALQAEQAAIARTLDLQYASSFWQLSGNFGTDPNTDFLGTRDAVSLTLGVSGVAAARIDTQGRVGIGTDAPSQRLTVRGSGLILGEDDPVARGYITARLDAPRSVYVSGKHAYVASEYNSRLAIFDVSDPDNIAIRGYTSANLDYPRYVYVSGQYAYVASSGNDRLAIFDVSDPDNIVARGKTSANLDYPSSVYVSGKYAYVASYHNSRLAIFDVSDPDNIVARGYTSTNLSLPLSVYVSGQYAYVASYYNDRLAIFDVSDPDNIVARGYITDTLDAPQSVYVSGKYAYVASRYNDRLAVFDVSDPDNIVARGYTSANLYTPQSVYVSGKYAYVASHTNDRLAIFELNHLESPTLETGNLQSGYLDVTDNAIVGNNLYVQGGLNVGPGGALVGGDLGVEGHLQVRGQYVQFPTISGAAPPAADCDDASEYGRVVVRTDGAVNLYVCTDSGWVGK